VDRNNQIEWPAAREPDFRVHLCVGPNCTARGSRALLTVLETAVEQAGLRSKVEITAATCRNRCEIGPSLNVYPGPFFYREVTPEAIQRIVSEHLVGGQPVQDHLVKIALPKLADLL
jgi:(2Fe-2S) ferredoxin